MEKEAPLRLVPSAALPLPLALVVLAFASDHPGAIVGALAGGAVLLAVSGAPVRVPVAIALISGLGLVLLNPLAGANGNLILVAGPRLGPVDLEVTLEELVYGAVAGARLAAAILLTAAALALVDPDRLLAGAMRIAPRGALLVALGARLLPALGRDAAALVEAARLRGLALGGKPRREAVRTGATLLVPLVATSLERGLDHAEALVARGYGSGPRTRLPERPPTRAERIGTALGALGVVPIAIVVTGGGATTWYPRLEAPAPAGWLAGALALALALGLALVARDLRCADTYREPGA